MQRIERLINLTAYLLYKQRPVTWEQLRKTVYAGQSTGGVALKRMFERDKDELREMGIDVQTERDPLNGESGYIIPRERYYLPELDLAPDERVALTMVWRLFLGSGTPFGGPAHSALLKFAFDEEPAEGEIPHVHWIESPQDRDLLDAILEGLVRRKYIEFSYRALDASEPVRRRVEPYGLFSRRGSWYVVGKCHLRGETRCFKLDRFTSGVTINQKKPHAHDFEVPPGFDIEEEARWEWPLPTGEEDIQAVVSFDPKLAFAYDGGHAEVVSTKRLRDGRLEATYEVGDPEQFVDWVLEFGTDAKLVSPLELVEIAKERLRGVIVGAKRR